METTSTAIMKGAGWLLTEETPAHTFIPEDFNEEQKMMMDMCHQFIEAEIYPLLNRIDSLEADLNGRSLSN